MEQANLAGWLEEGLKDWSGPIAVLLFALLAGLELALRRDSGESSTFGRIATNIGLFIVGVGVTFAMPVTIAGAAVWAAGRDVGLFNHVSVPAAVVFAVALVARTLAAYWLHRAFHQVPLLWRVHRVHHTDRQIDVSLGLRHHPLELIPAVILYAGVAVILGLPAWAVLLTELAMIAAGYWEHLALRLPDRARAWLEPWIVLPETHRLHHSADQSQTDSNYSSLTIIWDRLFGTFRPSSEHVERIGLGDEDDRIADSLWHQLAMPFRRSAAREAFSPPPRNLR